MGLLNLKEKIKKQIVEKHTQNEWSESDVLYLLVEMGKYIERSGKDLGDPNESKLNEDDFEAFMFFRNWVAHTEKERGKIPERILVILNEVKDSGNKEAEGKLLGLLVEEIKKICGKIGIEASIAWEDFFDKLKHILTEQPIKISDGVKYVGYEDDLVLRIIKPQR